MTYVVEFYSEKRTRVPHILRWEQTKTMNNRQTECAVDKYTVLTIGKVVVEWSDESIPGGRIFEGGEERLQFLWGVQTWNFT